MLEVYRVFMEEILALPVISGEKSEGERFPGADNTYTCEAMMSDRKALQAGTSHFLGQNFARAFDIKFQNQGGELEFAWTTSWGTSTRMIGAVVMAHSDDDGLILPPRLAPVKAVILPISTDAEKLEKEILPRAREIASALNRVLGPMAVQVDTDFHLRPGDRFFRHLQKGVPLRLELGEREMEAGKVRAVRRDTAEKAEISWESVATEIPALLENIQKALFERAAAFRDANTRHASSFEEMKTLAGGRRGSSSPPSSAETVRTKRRSRRPRVRPSGASHFRTSAPGPVSSRERKTRSSPSLPGPTRP